jgi:hypothetical protein
MEAGGRIFPAGIVVRSNILVIQKTYSCQNSSSSYCVNFNFR